MVGPRGGHALQRGAGEAGRRHRGQRGAPCPQARRGQEGHLGGSPPISTRCSPASRTCRCGCSPPTCELNRARRRHRRERGRPLLPRPRRTRPPRRGRAAVEAAVAEAATTAAALDLPAGPAQDAQGRRQRRGAAPDAGGGGAIESLQAATPTGRSGPRARAFFDALVFGGLQVGRRDQAALRQGRPAGEAADRRLGQGGRAPVPRPAARGRARAPGLRARRAAEGSLRPRALVSVPDTIRGSDDEALDRALRELRELTAQQKDTWLKYTSGNRARWSPRQAGDWCRRAARAAEPKREILVLLSRDIVASPAGSRRGDPPSEAQALEVATALLFIETALENYFRLGADFRARRTVTERVRARWRARRCRRWTRSRAVLDEMTRRAQERLLIFQVGPGGAGEPAEHRAGARRLLPRRREARRARDPRRPVRAGAGRAHDHGAVATAAALSTPRMARVQQFAKGARRDAGRAAEMVADGLSGLGLYITALQQGTADSARGA